MKSDCSCPSAIRFLKSQSVSSVSVDACDCSLFLLPQSLKEALPNTLLKVLGFALLYLNHQCLWK